MNPMLFLIAGYFSGNAVAFVGYWFCIRPRLARWKKSTTRELQLQMSQLARSEFIYWASQQERREPGIVLGAQGAAANILAAVNGKPAPWHRQQAHSEQRSQRDRRGGGSVEEGTDHGIRFIKIVIRALRGDRAGA